MDYIIKFFLSHDLITKIVQKIVFFFYTWMSFVQNTYDTRINIFKYFILFIHASYIF
jgi:hypothetical protein